MGKNKKSLSKFLDKKNFFKTFIVWLIALALIFLSLLILVQLMSISIVTLFTQGFAPHIEFQKINDDFIQQENASFNTTVGVFELTGSCEVGDDFVDDIVLKADESNYESVPDFYYEESNKYIVRTQATNVVLRSKDFEELLANQNDGEDKELDCKFEPSGVIEMTKDGVPNFEQYYIEEFGNPLYVSCYTFKQSIDCTIDSKNYRFSTDEYVDQAVNFCLVDNTNCINYFTEVNQSGQ